MVVVGLVIANVIITIAMIIDAVTMRGPIRVNGDLISSNEVRVGGWLVKGSLVKSILYEYFRNVRNLASSICLKQVIVLMLQL